MQVKFKIATCHSSLGENRAALAEVCTCSFFLLQVSYVYIVNILPFWTFDLYFLVLIEWWCIITESSFSPCCSLNLCNSSTRDILTSYNLNQQMEGIPSKSRNLEMNLMMAKLYRNSKHTRAAIGCFKECLRSATLV